MDPCIAHLLGVTLSRQVRTGTTALMISHDPLIWSSEYYEISIPTLGQGVLSYINVKLIPSCNLSALPCPPTLFTFAMFKPAQSFSPFGKGIGTQRYTGSSNVLLNSWVYASLCFECLYWNACSTLFYVSWGYFSTYTLVCDISRVVCRCSNRSSRCWITSSLHRRPHIEYRWA